ncbi:two-component system response regulator FixJ [Sphingomonas kyeonggiensis]|uniref:Two-component system response regulator FixJ n=1 Tax=Sphingomonas kyeonggiensis TaxID=1268553 RepID=A0A7W7K2J4_9SPHN|nr:response regulator FixJ [Sphingomonas kyeonggiensis]MBB4839829.1 two-component system response regulator FixJ [Sphingomonas kyeonggiensis]
MSDERLIHIVDDEESVRKSASFLLRTSGFDTRTYASGGALLREAAHAPLGCILLDIRMPDMDGLEVQRELNARGIPMPVIVLTGHGDISVAVQAMKAGAVDFIEKPFEKDHLLEAIASAFARLESVGDSGAEKREAQSRLEALSPREQDVLAGLVRGHPNKTIAYDLGISARTIEVHRANLMDKLKARSLSEALRIAFAAGLAD